MGEGKTERWRLMGFWLCCTFVIWCAISLTYYYINLAPIADVGTVLRAVWPVWATAAGGAIVIYVGYKRWLGRRDGETASPAPDQSSAPPA